MKKPIDPSLDRLGGCAVDPPRSPQAIDNPPGQPALRYRVAGHASLLATMRDRLARYPIPQPPPAEPRYPLRELRSRDPGDATLALLDAWAAAGEVLSFYDERIVQEHYLRTATERRSLLELGRTVGHQLAPGLAATAYLAFVVDDSPNAAETVLVPAGTKVGSVPGPGELPQTFETTRALWARPEWNEIKLRSTAPHPIPEAPGPLEVEGAPALEVGELVLAIASVTEPARSTVFRIAEVTRNPAGTATVTGAHGTVLTTRRSAPTTTLDLQTPVASSTMVAARVLPRLQFSALPAGVFVTRRKPLSRAVVLENAWPTAVFRALARAQHWPLRVARAIQPMPLAAPVTGVYSFAHRARLFGHNAPRYASLPTTPPRPSTDWDSGSGAIESEPFTLETTYAGVAPGSYAVFVESGQVRGWARITAVTEISMAAFGLSAKSARIDLDATQRAGTLSGLSRRETVVLVGSKPLPLTPLPIDHHADDTLALEGRYLVDQGDILWLRGERRDLPGITSQEMLTVRAAQLNGEVTKVELTAAVAHAYILSTVRINANVVTATHGETVEDEVLGSGDGQRVFQRFTLKKGPLTYVGASDGSGRRSTLEVRVNGLAWTEVETLYGRGSDERVFVTRHGDDGRAEVGFGDGRTGARLPTGAENVRARYRAGSGASGLVDAEKLSLMPVRPLGVRTVSNPLPATDAADPEGRDEARRTVPTVALTLDRVVSIEDYAAFAARFGGIVKADATWFWEGTRRVVVVTVAGHDAGEPSADRRAALVRALGSAGDSRLPVRVVVFRRAYFQIQGTVDVDPDRLRADVLADATSRLRARYGFQHAAFAGGVAQSEVIATIAATPGVRGVDLDAFHRHGGVGLEPRLVADAPRVGADGELEGAELLLLDPAPLDLR